jgi:diguanylate cyclase (GGDEF)-like protein
VLIHYYYRRTRKTERDFVLREEDLQEDVNLLLEEIKKSKLAVYAREEQIKRYNSLEHLIERLNSTLSQEEVCLLITSAAFRLAAKNKGTCILYLVDEEKESLAIASTQKEDAQEIIKSKKGDIFDNWVFKKNQPLIIADTKKDFRFDLEKIKFAKSRMFRSLIASCLVSGKRIVGVIRLDNPKENYFSSEDLRLLRAISDLGAVAVENTQLYRRTEELAITDGLTGLYLRRYLSERMDIEMIRVTKEKGNLSILMIDIDNFKRYNDKFGHVAGDIVLRTIAKILRETFDAAGDIIGRYGGEEFIVLMPNLSKSEAKDRAEELRRRIEDERIVLRKKSTKITVSIGLSTFPQDAKLRDELIQKADSALYRAKGKGRNLVCSA